MTMQKTSLRLPAWQIDALDAIADEAEATNRSELIRDGISYVVTEHKDEAPQWAVAESEHDRKRRRNRAKLRGMHFRQRTFEYVRDALFDDMGNMKEHPPSPGKMREYYGSMLRDEVRDEYPDHTEEYLEHVDEILDWYELMHPDTSVGSTADEAVALCAHYLKHEKKGMARKIADDAEPKTTMSKHELLDKARGERADETWRHKWDKSIKPWEREGDA